MDKGESEAKEVLCKEIPPLRVENGYYPVDVETTIETGWVTYGEFVVEDKGEQ